MDHRNQPPNRWRIYSYLNMNPYSLEGKLVLVTDAASDIGSQIARECASIGAYVLVQDKEESVLCELIKTMDGDGHRIIACDTTTEEGINELVAKCDKLDGLSINSNIPTTLLLKFINATALNKALTQNVIIPVTVLQKLVKAKKLKKGSSVVFLASVSGVYTVHYADSLNALTNGAVSAFVKGAALDLAAQGIRVNSVNPSVIETNEMLESSILTEEELDEKRNFFPLKRFGKPVDVAIPVVYLLSDASSWITGVHMPIDGGYTLL